MCQHLEIENVKRMKESLKLLKASWKIKRGVRAHNKEAVCRGLMGRGDEP